MQKKRITQDFDYYIDEYMPNGIVSAPFIHENCCQWLPVSFRRRRCGHLAIDKKWRAWYPNDK